MSLWKELLVSVLVMVTGLVLFVLGSVVGTAPVSEMPIVIAIQALIGFAIMIMGWIVFMGGLFTIGNPESLPLPSPVKKWLYGY